MAVLRIFGSRPAILAVTMLALGWFISAPSIIANHARHRPFSTDYLAFHSAGAQIRQDSGTLYDIRAQQDEQRRHAGPGDSAGFYEFRYPPVVAGAFTVFSDAQVATAYVAFVLMLLGVLAACGLCLYLLLGEVPRIRWSVTVVAMLGSTASITSLLVGQLTPILLCIALLGMLALRAQRPALGGVLLGLLFLKPHFAAVAFLTALASRQWRVAAHMAVSMAALAACSTALVGIETMREWVILLSHSEDASISIASEQNVYGLIATLTGIRGGVGVMAAHVIIAAGATLLVFRAIANMRYDTQERVMFCGAVGSMLILVVSPHVQFYDLALLWLPALFVVHRVRDRNEGARRAAYGLLVLAFFFVEIAGLLASARMSVSAPVLIAMLVALCNWSTVERVLFAATEDSVNDVGTQPLAA